MMNRFLLLLVVFAPLACSSPTPNPDALTGIRSQDRVIVAPLNLALRMPAEVDGMEEPVWHALLDHFETRGRAVQRIEAADARSLWHSVVSEMGESRELAGATSNFARQLAAHSEFDLLVMPAVVMRRAALRGHHAYWDGVRRRVRVDGAWDGPIDEIGGPGDLTYVRGLNGQLAGASLYVAVLTPDGRSVYQGLGGLDLLQEAKQARHAKRGVWRVVLREAPFATPRHLQEGIGLALERELPRTARAW
ncbi:MAG: hypothetical protein JRH16_21720 [Deltaproteobacteria bacterium]|nr:hypothetical protein [Deltaproteobacteria bacterium]MBW2361167.1 hypothetical protein [Deltaproteobacteria bacterium]